MEDFGTKTNYSYTTTAVIAIPMGLTRRKQPQGGLIKRAMYAGCRNITCFGFSDENRPTDINVTLLDQVKKA